jgi:dihydrolipoamide dehydrogenase
MADRQFDVVVIGGGPAGYVGAIRAAQLGLSVACVERGQLGGVCNNWGCIPTKALLAGAELYARLKHEAADWGILADNIRHDWSKVIGRSRSIADLGGKGIASLFKKHKITHVQGHARITAAGKVEVHKTDPIESAWDTAADAKAARTTGGVTERLTCKHIVIATGAIARSLPGAEFDGNRIIGAKDAMSLPEQPKHLIVIGAGAIGMEFAYFYNAFGTKVTVVEMLDRVLPNEDADVSAAVDKSFRKQGIDLHVAHKTTSVKPSDDGVEVTIASVKDEGKSQTLKGDRVLVAIGVRGRYDGLFSPNVKVETFKDHIKVDKRTYATSVKGIYAVGDVIGPPWLAHVASEEAIVCVERIAGHHADDIDYGAIPGCTYCLPQVASLGSTEQTLQAQGLKAGSDYTVGKFPFLASGKARAMGNTEGFIKLLTDKKTGEILGVHMVGESVTELLAEMGLAKRLEATTDELIATMHAHPTLSEAVHEAALGAMGRMIHF